MNSDIYGEAIHRSLKGILDNPINLEKYNNDPAFHAFVTMIVQFTVRSTLDVVEGREEPKPVDLELLMALISPPTITREEAMAMLTGESQTEES